MYVNYAPRSKFLVPCETAIRGSLGDLASKRTICIRLQEPRSGYAGCVQVTVSRNDPTRFATDWTSDPSRFPARIKAAATALQRCRCFGVYRISHNDGTIEITRI